MLLLKRFNNSDSSSTLSDVLRALQSMPCNLLYASSKYMAVTRATTHLQASRGLAYSIENVGFQKQIESRNLKGMIWSDNQGLLLFIITTDYCTVKSH
jgi:hypothetical protein